MPMEGDKIQNKTVILVCMVLGSHGSDTEKYHLVGFCFFLKHDFTCSMPEDICDSGHNMLPFAQFL
jgi:hypothetical protein